MAISIFFSAFVYNTQNREIERSFLGFPIELRETDESLYYQATGSARTLDPQVQLEAKQRLLFNLISLNIVVLLISSWAGYFLAGRTLKPIQEMVDEQNRFTSDASHELRTPLTALETSIEVGLRDKTLNLEKAKDLLHNNLEDVIRLRTLSNSLLTLDQLSHVTKNATLEQIPIKEIINETIAKLDSLAKQKEIIIDTSLNQEKVEGIREVVVELFVILVDNAIKYSPEKSKITINSRQKGNFVTIDIIDKGLGIRASDLPHLFKRFYRAESSRSKKGTGGYGLGLSIAKKIVDMHQGSIDITSTLGHGSTFSVTLPSHQPRIFF